MDSQTIVGVEFEENIEESDNKPLKDEYATNNNPIEPVGTRILKNIRFISNPSAVEEVEELHHNKCSEDEGEVSRMHMILLVVKDVVSFS